MRVLALVMSFAGLFALPAAATENAPTHPSEVAFVGEGAKGFVYRRFPGGERLYVSDRDRNGRSSCMEGCASAWPPVYAPADAAPVGEWTIVQRGDGRRQWALKGRPVYTRFHDSSEIATGDGIDGVWHLVGYTQVAANPPAP